MVLVALSWGWIGISSFLLGFAAMQGIGKVTGEGKPESLELYILLGLLCLTVYAQIFSLIGGGKWQGGNITGNLVYGGSGVIHEKDNTLCQISVFLHSYKIFVFAAFYHFSGDNLYHSRAGLEL